MEIKYDDYLTIYQYYMQNFGENVASRTTLSKDEYNRTLLQQQMLDDHTYDLDDDFNIIFMKNNQQIAQKEIYGKYFKDDPQFRNDTGIVNDNDLILQGIGLINEQLENKGDVQ